MKMHRSNLHSPSSYNEPFFLAKTRESACSLPGMRLCGCMIDSCRFLIWKADTIVVKHRGTRMSTRRSAFSIIITGNFNKCNDKMSCCYCLSRTTKVAFGGKYLHKWDHRVSRYICQDSVQRVERKKKREKRKRERKKLQKLEIHVTSVQGGSR